jgi:hypothetical protein
MQRHTYNVLSVSDSMYTNDVPQKVQYPYQVTMDPCSVWCEAIPSGLRRYGELDERASGMPELSEKWQYCVGWGDGD